MIVRSSDVGVDIDVSEGRVGDRSEAVLGCCYDSRAMPTAPSLWLRLWLRIEWKVDERWESTIASSCDRAKKSSSPSYGDEPEFILTRKGI